MRSAQKSRAICSFWKQWAKRTPRSRTFLSLASRLACLHCRAKQRWSSGVLTLNTRSWTHQMKRNHTRRWDTWASFTWKEVLQRTEHTKHTVPELRLFTNDLFTWFSLIPCCLFPRMTDRTHWHASCPPGTTCNKQTKFTTYRKPRAKKKKRQQHPVVHESVFRDSSMGSNQTKWFLSLHLVSGPKVLKRCRVISQEPFLYSVKTLSSLTQPTIFGRGRLGTRHRRGNKRHDAPLAWWW